MGAKTFTLVARVSTENTRAVRRTLQDFIARGSIKRTEEGFLVEAKMSGTSARNLNRILLSALRRIERKTRLRAEWTSGGTTERFFDYVPKGSRHA
jgi:hypothetical protein